MMWFPERILLFQGASQAGDGFEVTKLGMVELLFWFSKCGNLTGAQSEAAPYEFTTLNCIPGIIHENDAKIQLLDLPGIIEGVSEKVVGGRLLLWRSALMLC